MRVKLFILTILLSVLTSISNITHGQIGIGTSATTTMLDINGSLRLDHSSKGNGRIIKVSEEGYAKWEPIEYYDLYKGSFSDYGIINFIDDDIPTFSGATITLPPGTYLVNIIFLLTSEGKYSSDMGTFTSIYFSDSNTDSMETRDYITNSAKSISGKLTGPSLYGLIDGSVVIKNSTNGNKTYYVWAIKKSYKSDATIPDSELNLIYFGSGEYWGENIIYAIPISEN